LLNLRRYGLEKPKIKVEFHHKFVKWRSKLKDVDVEALIAMRLKRIREKGNFGDHEFVGGGVWELRILYGPGYRLYYTWAGGMVILLLSGGVKTGQKIDIKRAKRLAKELKREKGR
jgi:putative addiction module killer protein